MLQWVAEPIAIFGLLSVIWGCRAHREPVTAFAVAARGTVAEGAALSVKVLPVRHRCRNCSNNFEASPTDCPCPACGHPHTEMIGGEELQLLDMELADVA